MSLTFDPTPPPEPTPEQIEEAIRIQDALLQAQMAKKQEIADLEQVAALAVDAAWRDELKKIHDTYAITASEPSDG